MALTFAVGADFDAIEECRAWRRRDAQGEVEASYALARLKLVNRYGLGEAETDRWSPPLLYLSRQGRLSLIYSAAAASASGQGRADTLALCFCDMRKAPSAAKFETEARRRLEAIGDWRQR